MRKAVIEYTELHCHSNFSLLDGASHLESMVARAIELGMKALAITDHDGLYGAVRFYKAAREAGVKPIIGAELVLEGGFHLILLAQDRAGYSNLCRLISRAHLRHGKHEAFVDWETLSQHSAGLICLSGCRKGEVASYLLQGRSKEAVEAALRYVQLFGKDAFWIELQNHFLPDDIRLCDQLVGIANELGVGYVASNNVHYAKPEGHRLHDVLVCIKNRTILDESAHLRRPNDEYYLKSGEEMASLFSKYPDAITNSSLIAEMCSIEFNFHDYCIPEFLVPQGETSFTYLRKLCYEGAREKYNPLTPAVIKQLEHELGVIQRMQLTGYFLMVWDIMRYARERGIPAQGRGSAADSLVCYVMGITRVDPLRYNLLFERFLNEERQGTPDIDIDVSTNHREELLQYVYRKYGEEHTAMVCNVVTFQARNAVRDVGKALGLPLHLLDRLAKSLDRYSATDLAEEVKKLKEFRDKAQGPLWQQFLSLCHEIADFPRHLSIHVGGMLATSCPLVDVVPLESATAEGRIVTQWDKDDIEELGLIKVDLLGLRMLSLIQEALELIEQHRGIKLRLDDIPLDDPEVYKMLCEADTIGVFQVESRAQMQTLPKTKPRCLDDLVTEVAIIRPGPLQGNMVHPYLRRRQGLEKVTYLHPSLKLILEETLGVVLFQEQIIRIAVEVAGFTPGKAEQLRRAMGKKRSKEEMEKLRASFIEGARAKSVSKATANKIFDQLASFASFGFCKSHAAAFARTCYESAYLKVHHPTEFYCALLNNQPMGFYSPEVIVNDAKHHGVPILPADINRSSGKCTVEEGRVRLGFCYVKEMGEASIRKIEEEGSQGFYCSLRDLYQRTRLERNAIENLILVGALDCFQIPKRQLLWQLGLIMHEPDRALPLDLHQDQPILPEVTDMEQVAADYRIQGLSHRHHPMELLRRNISQDGILRSSEIKALFSDTNVRVAGYVVCRQAPGTAKGHVFLTLEDEDGLLNVVLRPRVYEKYRHIARMEPLVVVEGILQKKDGTINILAERLLPLRQERERQRLLFPIPDKDVAKSPPKS
jgi:error-prone DNA polymerase